MRKAKKMMEKKLEQTVELTERDFVNFVGDNADNYLRKFRKFNVDGADKFAWTWHWPAFFFGFWWLLYRKLHAWALITFFLVSIPLWLFGSSLVYGVIANYVYYKHAKKKIIKYKTAAASVNSAQGATALRKIGGVHRWEPFLAAFILLAIITFSYVHTRYYGLRAGSYKAAAKSELHYAAAAQENYFADHEKYAESIELLVTPEYGLRRDERVVITVIDASSTSYTMSAYHKSGNKLYFMDGPKGKIQEMNKSD